MSFVDRPEIKNIVSDPKIRYMYFKDPLTPRIVTVATRWTKDKGVLEIGFSANSVEVFSTEHFVRRDGKFKWACMENDVFNKRTARAIAAARLNKKPRRIRVADDQKRIDAVVEYFLSHEEYIPSPIRATVKRSRQEVLGTLSFD